MKTREAKLKKIADNLTQVAKDIIDFILKNTATIEAQEAHKKTMIDIFNTVEKEYGETDQYRLIISQLKRTLHSFTRNRIGELTRASQMLSDVSSGDKIAMLDIIAGFFSHGGVEETSANTLLFNELIKRLPHYQSLNEDERLQKSGFSASGSIVGIREVFRTIFIELAKQTITNYFTQMEKQAELLRSQKPKEPKPLLLDPMIKDKLETIFRKPNPMDSIKLINDYQPKKLDPEKFSQIMRDLDAIFAKETSTFVDVKLPQLFATDVVPLSSLIPKTKLVIDGPSINFSEARANLNLFFIKKAGEQQSSLRDDQFQFLPRS